VLPRDDAVVFVTVDAVYSVSRLHQTHPDVVMISRNIVAPTGNAYAIFPSTRPDRFWVAQPLNILYEFRTDGHAIGRYHLPDGWVRPIGGVEDDRVLLETDRVLLDTAPPFRRDRLGPPFAPIRA
jgi:hypothetical protein